MKKITPFYLLITKTNVLLALFVTALVITGLFPYLSKLWNLTLLDGISQPYEARNMIMQMNDQQRAVHCWITSTLDVLYPLVYGCFFAGVALRCFPKFGSYLIIPILFTIPVDLFEGVIQVLALTNTIDLLNLKAFITPLKSGLFLFGFAVAVSGGLRCLIKRLRSN